MIYTITLNPALDRTLWVEKLKSDDTNRIENEHRYAGGKGVDVSRVLKTLHVENRAIGMVGGFTGAELEGMLLNGGIACDFIRIMGETRINIVINDMSTGNQMVFSDRGPEVKPYELMQLIYKVEAVQDPEMMVVSGSLPPGIHAEIYRRIIEMAKAKGAKVILDTDGDSLKVGIQGFPDVIKPNIHELSRLVDKELTDIKDITGAAQSIHERGVSMVLVSMGARGILLLGETGRYLASPPKVKVVNTIGAGDSAIAGLVCGLVNGKSIEEAVAYAVAAGTATTMKPGTALCTCEDFTNLIPQVKVEKI